MTIDNYGQEMSAPSTSSDLLRVDEFSRRLKMHHHHHQQLRPSVGGQQAITTATNLVGVKGNKMNGTNSKNPGSNIKSIQRGRRDESPDVTEAVVTLRGAKKGGSEESSSSSSEMEEEEAASSSASSEEDDGVSEEDEDDPEEVNGQNNGSRDNDVCQDSRDDDTSNDEGNSSSSSSSIRSCGNFQDFPPELDFMGGSDKSKRRTDRYDSSESSDSGVATLSPSTSDSSELISSPYSPCCDLSLDASSTISSSSSGVGSSPSLNSNSSCCEDLPPSSPESSISTVSTPPPPNLHSELEPLELSSPIELEQNQKSTIQSLKYPKPLSPGTLLGHPIVTAVSAVLAAGDNSSSTRSLSHNQQKSKLPVTNFISFQIPNATKSNSHLVVTTNTKNQSPFPQYNNPIKLLSLPALSTSSNISAFGGKIIDTKAKDTASVAPGGVVLPNLNSLSCDVLRPSVGSNITCATLSKLSNATISTSTGNISVNKSLSSATTANRINLHTTSMNSLSLNKATSGVGTAAGGPTTDITVTTTSSGVGGTGQTTGSGGSQSSSMNNLFATALNYHKQQQKQKDKLAVPATTANNNNNNSTTINKNHPPAMTENNVVTECSVGRMGATVDLNGGIKGSSKKFQSTVKLPSLRGSSTGTKSFVPYGESQKSKVIIVSVSPESKVSSSNNSNSKSSNPSPTDLLCQRMQKSGNIISPTKASGVNSSSANQTNLSNTLKAINGLSNDLSVAKVDSTSTSATTAPGKTPASSVGLANGTPKKPRLSANSLMIKSLNESTPIKTNASTFIENINAESISTKIGKHLTGPKKTEVSKSIVSVNPNWGDGLSIVGEGRNSSVSPPSKIPATPKKSLPMSPTHKWTSGRVVSSGSSKSSIQFRNRKRKLSEDIFATRTITSTATTTTPTNSSLEVLRASSMPPLGGEEPGQNACNNASSSLECTPSTSVVKKSEKRLACAKSERASSTCKDSGFTSGITASIQSASSITVAKDRVSAIGPLKPLIEEGECRWKGCKVKGNLNILEHIQTAHVASQVKANGSQEEDKAKEYVCLWEGCKVYSQKSTSKQWIENHVLNHSGERPFKCIFPGCGQSFRAENALAKHVDRHVKKNHINTSGTSVGAPGTSSFTNNKIVSSPLKASRRKKQRYRKQRVNITGQHVDYFDKRTMEVIKHRLSLCTGAHTVNPHHCTFTAQVLATSRVEGAQEPHIFVHWFPENVIPDEWVPESKYSETKLVPLTRLPKDKMHILYPSIIPPPRTEKASRKFKKPTPPSAIMPPEDISSSGPVPSTSSAASCCSSGLGSSSFSVSNSPLSTISELEDDNTQSKEESYKMDDDEDDNEDEGIETLSKTNKSTRKDEEENSGSKQTNLEKMDVDEDEDDDYDSDDDDNWGVNFVLNQLYS